MPTTGGPGQQATPNPIKAMPVTRATSIAAPASLSPNNNCPTSDGAISIVNPVTASTTAAKISTFFIGLLRAILLIREFLKARLYLAVRFRNKAAKGSLAANASIRRSKERTWAACLRDVRLAYGFNSIAVMEHIGTTVRHS